MSVAARLLGMHPQTLRKYERFGLVEPSRSLGRSRLYSDDDIARLRIIRHLVENVGLNLAGVELTLQLIEGLSDLHRTMSVQLGPEQREQFEQRINKLMAQIGMAGER
jgi:MerR family transcriptional regulator/heat shock protein HspR